MLPTAKFGKYELGRLIIGGGPFCGISHYSKAKTLWMRRFLTVENSVALLQKCASLGINAIQGRGDDIIFNILDAYEQKTGARLNFIAQTAPERGGQAKSIEEIAQHKPIAIYIRGANIDSGKNPLMDLEKRIIRELPDYLKQIHDLGFMAGVGGHTPEVIDICLERDYEVDFHMQTINSFGFFCRAAPERVSKSIKATPRPVLAFKILGSGRVAPPEAFELALNSIKPTDFLVVGMTFPEEVEENVGLVEEFTGVPVEAE
ncbi:MAG: hypothetical protein AMS15_05860 [Planctomycetes bacterium DG_23]|nr:MAG: hypothetical protein AMS15_05860 [Planctomycetes bacterium DG_23]